MSEFHSKHIGPTSKEVTEMLSSLGCNSLDELLEKIVPKNILDIDGESIGNENFTENDILKYVKKLGSQNQIFRSLIGQGYYDTITPNVVLRNILERGVVSLHTLKETGVKDCKVLSNTLLMSNS